ncbi:MAG TPA: sensor histidine kinase [Nocardioidaceae bacterium]|nr:sensor histidine kinase [Nocardioidaceae bacterium]
MRDIRWNGLVDGALAGVVGALGLAEVWVPFPSVMGEGSRVLSSAVVVALACLLAFRRRWPLPIAVGVLAVWPVVFAISPVLVLFFGQLVPMTVAVFSVARHAPDRQRWYGAAAAAASLLSMHLLVEVLQDPSEIAFHWGVFLIAFAFGSGLRRSEQRAIDSTRRAVEAELSVRASALAAVAEERARIARELHDVVAHALSVMVVQAGAAEQVVDDDPAYVRAALDRIRRTGTSTLAEMRRLVTMLREDDAPGALAPQPSIAELGELIDDARRSGLDVTLSVEGEPRPLPAGLDLAAYRIVQEALTNVRRHAGASRADVQLTYRSQSLEIEVTDDGRGETAAVASESGHGLIGMRERAGLYGGTVLAAPGTEGGFVVHATLPAAS